MGRARSARNSGEGGPAKARGYTSAAANGGGLEDEVVAGMTLSEWLSMPWWPHGCEAQVMPGPGGHDREIVVNFGDAAFDGGDPGLNFRSRILGPVFDALVAALPREWSIDNRGTRIEVHPSGRFAGGFTADDVEIVRAATLKLGFVVRD